MVHILLLNHPKHFQSIIMDINVHNKSKTSTSGEVLKTKEKFKKPTH